ncbi:MAG TPA: prolipoprotein diacylglyceryl transferase [Gammaproteobacteria bacterium]|nr:prolipoprotein diacylglyceryl transferase [Gammaproteobacteria bacterium]
MLTYPDINPVALQIGPLAIHWYGIMYVLGFAGVFWSCNARRTESQSRPWERDEIVDLLFYGAMGVIFGGTLGYLLFYQPQVFFDDPLRLFRFWEPGRSFHGGLLGVLLAVFIFDKVHRRHFWAITDFIAPAIPIGIMAGRLGNFINGELWGRITNMPWGIIFPHAGAAPRHPSQLYEFGLEGLCLFLILNVYARKPRKVGAVSGLFLVCYGLFRFGIEFFREPDFDQGFIALGWMTKGQILSLPMVVIGLFLLFYTTKYQKLYKS